MSIRKVIKSQNHTMSESEVAVIRSLHGQLDDAVGLFAVSGKTLSMATNSCTHSMATTFVWN
jgi:hypothetical protein